MAIARCKYEQVIGSVPKKLLLTGIGIPIDGVRFKIRQIHASLPNLIPFCSIPVLKNIKAYEKTFLRRKLDIIAPLNEHYKIRWIRSMLKVGLPQEMVSVDWRHGSSSSLA